MRGRKRRRRNHENHRNQEIKTKVISISFRMQYLKRRKISREYRLKKTVKQHDIWMNSTDGLSENNMKT